MLPNFNQSPNRSEAKSFVAYVGDGVTKEYRFDIEYLRREFIKVEIDGVRQTEWVFKASQVITLVNPVPVEAILTIKRITDASRIVEFIDGSILKSKDLNISAIQTVHIAEESRDYMTNTVGVDDEGNIDARFKRIVRVQAPIDPLDATNKQYVDSEGQFAMEKAHAQATASANSAAAAKASEDKAKASEGAAKDSETKAKASEVAAKDSEVKAKDSEVAAKASENTVVPLVPIVDQAAKDAAAASAQADDASKRAEQAVVDVKNLGAVPIGAVLDYPVGLPLPAGYLECTGAKFDTVTYPDLKTLLGKDTLPKASDTSKIMFTVEWWGGNRSTIPVGAVPADGQTITNAMFPEAVAKVNTRSVVPVAFIDVWDVDNSIRGKYGISRTTTTDFRTPDYNGKSAGALGAPFLRGDGLNSASVLGQIQGDAIRNIVGDLSVARPSAGGSTGVFTVLNQGVSVGGTSNVVVTSDINFNAARLVPTANENRPLNVTGCFIIWLAVPSTVSLIKAAGVIANEGMAQLDGVVKHIKVIDNSIASLNNNVTSLEVFRREEAGAIGRGGNTGRHLSIRAAGAIGSADGGCIRLIKAENYEMGADSIIRSNGDYIAMIARADYNQTVWVSTAGIHIGANAKPQGLFAHGNLGITMGDSDTGFRWSSDGNIQYITNNTHAGTFNTDLVWNGNITSHSDRRLKKDLKVIPDALAKVNAISGYTYTRIDTGDVQAGVIAQEVEKVLPEVVRECDGTKSVAYGNITALLIEAVKELSAKVTLLEGELYGKA